MFNCLKLNNSSLVFFSLVVIGTLNCILSISCYTPLLTRSISSLAKLTEGSSSLRVRIFSIFKIFEFGVARIDCCLEWSSVLVQIEIDAADVKVDIVAEYSNRALFTRTIFIFTGNGQNWKENISQDLNAILWAGQSSLDSTNLHFSSLKKGERFKIENLKFFLRNKNEYFVWSVSF